LINKKKVIELAITKPDDFQSGALITDKNRKIVYANVYFSDELNWDLKTLVGQSSDNLFTYSSQIFCESYLMPLLFHEKKCEEMQLTLLDGNGERIPIIINAKMDDQGHIYWSFFNASKRDKLYEELIVARKELEAQAKTLLSMASTDELTGLMNRRELNLRAPQLISQAKRYGHTTALLMVDIDHFKKVNDSFGHLEGDRVLKQLGQKLLNFGRQTDIIARFGGEEFIMLLPVTGATDVNLFTDRLHDLVSEIEVNNTPISVSIGVTISDGDQNIQNLISKADAALYKAKINGRNRTEFYQDI
jgi:diguanylate cyclase (GGDEF)-like protein